MFKDEKKKKAMMEKRQKDIMGDKEKKGATSYAKLAVYGVVVSTLLYILWNWIVWKFFWTGKDDYMFAKKNN